MLSTLLIIAGGGLLYLVGHVNGREVTDDESLRLLDKERHDRIVAQEYAESLERELYAAMVHNENLARQHDQMLLKLVRHGIERGEIERLLQPSRSPSSPACQATTQAAARSMSAI